MTTELRWGDLLLPLPDKDGIKVTRAVIGSKRRKKDGALVGNYTATKRTVSVTWTALSADERMLLYDVLDHHGTTVCRLDMPDGQTMLAASNLDDVDETQWFDANDAPYYDVTVVWEET